MIGRNRRDRAGEQVQRAQLPLLDRLCDDAPDHDRDPVLSFAEAMDMLRRSVRRDLEALLNARRRWRSWPSGYSQLAVSPVGYGIGDFTAGAFNDPSQREQLRLDFETAIRRFEPRLTQVRVSLIDSDTLESTLRLRVDAMLRCEPAPEPIAFDTVVDATTAEVAVRANSGIAGDV